MNKLLTAVAITLIPLAGIAAEGARPPGTFDAFDTNKDGRISMPEAAADPTLVENFSAADKNGDGYLDHAEFDQRAEPPQR